jgi:hypothetical protein
MRDQGTTKYNSSTSRNPKVYTQSTWYYTPQCRMTWGNTKALWRANLARPENMGDTGEYQYLPLQKHSQGIRVISLLSGRWEDDIHCDIRTILLDHQPDYGALSYVWGDSAITKPIFIDKMEVQVTTNLESALQHLGSPVGENIESFREYKSTCMEMLL